MNLEFIQTSSSPKNKSDFLRHMTEIVNIKLSAGSTYNNLFDKILEHFIDNKEKHTVALDWIDFNKKGQDISVFNDEIINVDGYAIFNIRK